MSNDVPPQDRPGNPLAAIFFSPRKAIRGIVSTNAAYGVTALTAVAGITFLVSTASSLSLGDLLTTGGVLVAAVVLGLPVGWFMMWLMTALTRVTGGWLGGRATHEQLRSAIVWGNAPAVLMIPVFLAGCALYGNEYFSSSKVTMHWYDPAVLALSLVSIVITIWTVVLSSHTIAEVQGFPSGWMGFLNFFLATLFVTIVFAAIGAVAAIAVAAAAHYYRFA